MEHRNYDPTEHLPAEVTEVVQRRGQTIVQTRQTVQDPLKVTHTYYLAGDTAIQKVNSLRQLAATRIIGQNELIGYCNDIISSPFILETINTEDVPLA